MSNPISGLTALGPEAVTASDELVLVDVSDTTMAPSGTDKRVLAQLALRLFAQTADKTVSNTTTVSSIVGTGIGTVTIPTAAMVAGKSIRLRARGAFNSIASPGTINLQLFLGSTRVCFTSALTLSASQTGRYWDGEFDLTFRSVGASGSVYASGKALFSTTVGIDGNVSVTPINTTTDLAIDLRAGFSVADPGNSITTSILTIEVVN